KDFGWVLDFEDSLLYPRGVTIIRKFRPVLSLSQGTFYTHQLSKSKFELLQVGPFSNSELGPLNQLPRLVGAAVEIPPGKAAVLKIDGVETPPLEYMPNVNYEIQFVNDCIENNGSHCKWDYPTHANETRRNDFHMHHFMFARNNFAGKRGVIVKERDQGVDLDMCPTTHKDTIGTDEAPCMGAGFGRHTDLSPILATKSGKKKKKK
ncbi:MAG TPA: hypothetical protein VFS77_23615, partial [Pyrinomonadaceae bacterium]|nr:hypothetical protein [Pyrinomonadaceae bacterium]